MLGTHIRNLGKAGNLCAITDQFVGMASTHFSGTDNRNIDSAVGRGITLSCRDVEGKINGAEANDACLRKNFDGHRLG